MSIHTRTALFATYCLAFLVANLHVVGALVDYSRQNESASHVMLIPFVTLALIIQDRRSVFPSARFDWIAGVVAITAGIGLLAIVGGLTAAVSGLVAMATGGFVLFYGLDSFRAALFSLFFLAFMIPIPPAILDVAISFLKTWSTEAVAVLFELTGTPYYREGFIFTLPSAIIHVADECSGIRSSVALLLTSLLAGHTFLSSGWRKALLVVAILPITILKNAIRIVTLTLLSLHVHPGFLSGRLHHEGGIVFFLLALGILAPVLAILRSSETQRNLTPTRVCRD